MSFEGWVLIHYLSIMGSRSGDIISLAEHRDQQDKWSLQHVQGVSLALHVSPEGAGGAEVQVVQRCRGRGEHCYNNSSIN